MGASQLVGQVYLEHIAHFGEPDESIVYDGGKAISGFPERIDVLVWEPTADLDITTLATIGMSDAAMPGASHRAELHFAVRKELARDEMEAASLFLANLAMYPFHHEMSLDWWNTIQKPGAIPAFDKAQSALLHPRFVEDGWDTIHVDGTEVRILNVVPVTLDELKLKQVDRLAEELGKIDIFAPR